jgi:hypothetical protein
MRRLAICIALSFLGASSSSAPPHTQAEAQRALCADLAAPAPPDGPRTDAALQRLQADANLFEAAGDKVTAEGIRALVNALRAGNKYSNLGKEGMRVFLLDEASQSQIDAIKLSLSRASGVVSVTFESKADAFARFKRDFADHPELILNVSPDALPASFRVRLSSPGTYDQLAASVKSMPGVGNDSRRDRRVWPDHGAHTASRSAEVLDLPRAYQSVGHQ